MFLKITFFLPSHPAFLRKSSSRELGVRLEFVESRHTKSCVQVFAGFPDQFEDRYEADDGGGYGLNLLRDEADDDDDLAAEVGKYVCRCLPEEDLERPGKQFLNSVTALSVRLLELQCELLLLLRVTDGGDAVVVGAVVIVVAPAVAVGLVEFKTTALACSRIFKEPSM